MVESRYVLYGLIAGILSGITGSALFIALVGFDNMARFTYELTYDELIATGLPPQNASRAALMATREVSYFSFIVPFGPLLNMLILGPLIGALQDYLVRRGLRPVLAAGLAGGFYIVFLNLLPIYGLSFIFGGLLLDALLKYIGPLVIFLPPALYVVLLIVFSAYNGPWSRIKFSEPRIY